MTPIKFTLTRPIEQDGKTISEITLDRPPNVGDLVAGDAFTGNVKRTAAILASMTGVTLPAIMRMSSRDFVAIGSVLSPMLGLGQDDEPGEA